MKKTEFYYDLPSELIARYPQQTRTGSRLLVLDKDENNEFHDHYFPDLLDWLNPGDLLVYNDTKVIPARLHGRKESGGKLEVLIDRILNKSSVLTHIRANRSPVNGSRIFFDDGAQAMVVGRQGDLFRLRFSDEMPVLEYLKNSGEIPLPPYLGRKAEALDNERYQTVYARQQGAVAAPTAGLHFDEKLIQKIRSLGVGFVPVTLHVGAGTFQPVREESVCDHTMHEEWVKVSEEVCNKIYETRLRGGRVIAIGTTTVRSLETAARGGQLQPFEGNTSLYILPGHVFQVVDAMITNFHLPESTLLMLVCAFGGMNTVMDAYSHAIREGYRFFSYGDAMLLEKAS